MENTITNKGVNRGYVISIILIIIGAVCLMAGICLSSGWLTGIGIGTICVSGVISYYSMAKVRRDPGDNMSKH